MCTEAKAQQEGWVGDLRVILCDHELEYAARMLQALIRSHDKKKKNTAAAVGHAYLRIHREIILAFD